MGKARVPAWVWGVMLVSHLLAFTWAMRTRRWDFPDSGRYRQAAANLRAHGQLYARPWPAAPPQGQAVQEFTIRPLGYPAVVLASGAAEKTPVMLLLVQNLLSLLNLALVVGWWSRRIQLTHWQWGGTLLLLLYPGQLIYANAVMSEMVLQTVVVTLMGLGIRLIATRRTRYFTGSCVAVVVALLLKPVFCPLAAVMAVVGLGLAWQWRRPWLALVGLGPLLVAGGYMQWNQQRTGYFHFSSITEINLLHYNAAGVIRQVAGGQAENKWVGAVLTEADARPTFAGRQAFIDTQAMAVLYEHPVVYARQHLQGMALCLLDPGRFDISQFLHLKPPVEGGLLTQSRTGGLMRAVAQLPKALLALLAMAALANLGRLGLAVRGFGRLKTGGAELRYGRWLAVGLIGYVVVLTGPLGAARFLVPVWPLLLGLALVGWVAPGQAPSGPEETAPVREDQR